jgi:hypothetical protein
MKHHPIHQGISLLLVGMLLALAPAPAIKASALDSSIWYVKPGATGGCSSWADACELQTALGLAGSGDQIWVATGVYTPGSAGNRLATFPLQGGVALYGGFAGTETSLEDRDWVANPTTLSGDIDGDGGLAGNTYHVVSAVGINETARLDGLIITAGNADASTTPQQWGGGLYTQNSNLAIQHVLFEGNLAAGGGGMFSNGGLQPVVLEDVEFSQNTSTGNGGGLHTF